MLNIINNLIIIGDRSSPINDPTHPGNRRDDGSRSVSCGISHYGDCHMARKIIKIERYEARPAGHNRTKWYAIGKDGKEYEMPDAFVNGYTDDYLAIEWTKSEMPEVLDLPPEGFYIPIRTAPLKAAKS